MPISKSLNPILNARPRTPEQVQVRSLTRLDPVNPQYISKRQKSPLGFMKSRIANRIALVVTIFAASWAVAQLPGMPPPQQYPWSDMRLAPDQRADLVIKEMTLDEKISLLHGVGAHFLAERGEFGGQAASGSGPARLSLSPLGSRRF